MLPRKERGPVLYSARGTEIQFGSDGLLHEEVLPDMRAGLLRRGAQARLPAADSGGQGMVGAAGPIRDDTLSPFRPRLTRKIFEPADFIAAANRTAETVRLQIEVFSNGREPADRGGNRAKETYGNLLARSIMVRLL